MLEHKTERQAREEILKLVAAYCDKYHKKKNIKRGSDSLCVPRV
ncbi:hypothetical protein C823_000159 [Eubacterium plexicaudatum ASF492]|nr:hypothetical protein C823_000159 [Eubacterium plexicaudatum ASF492]